MQLLQHADYKNITTCSTDTTHYCSECSKISLHRTGSDFGHKLREI